MKLFYLHVPKTAGSSINKFITDNVEKSRVHIESLPDLNRAQLEEFDYVSGHVPYNRIEKILNLKDWETIASFREPVEYVASHIRWIRRLADKEQRKRFEQHTAIFQKVALYMADLDLSKPEDISQLIAWLESINFYYLHNTQSIYLNSALQTANPSSQQVQQAIKNLHSIDYVVTSNNVDDFLEIISSEFNWKLPNKTPKINVNNETYGLDINDGHTVSALQKLISIDKIIYSEACTIASKQLEIFKLNEAGATIPRIKTSSDKLYKGIIDKVTSNQVHGWLSRRDEHQPLMLELYINSTLVQTKKSDVMRKGVLGKGLHPNGHCGFIFEVTTKIDTQDHIEVKEKGSNFTLTI